MIQYQTLRSVRLILVATIALMVSTSWAQKPATAKPDAPAEEASTLILSDTLHYDDLKKESTFTGNVVMTRGLMTMNSDALKLREDSEGSQYGVATVAPGKLVFIRQERPENFEGLEGLGQRAEYDGKNEIFDLIGQAVVTRYICGQPFDTISGQKVRYSQKTDVYEAFAGTESSNPGGRVRSVAQPRSKTDAAIAACKQIKATSGSAAVPTGPKAAPAAAPTPAPRR